ncbi:hypothetical protein MMC17_005499 [Xylographa soralifera]|nr:hypothetical protein [Xylographa soralifera]
MPLILSQTIEEKDYDALFTINYRAFADEPVLLALYPGGLDPSARAANLAGFKSGLGWTDPSVAAAKVIDNRTGQICAFATMRIYTQNPFLSTKDCDIQLPHVDAAQRPFLEWFFTTKSNRRRCIAALQVQTSYGCKFQTALGGSNSYECVDLQALCTDPDRRREGAATLLLEWATNMADENNFRVMLEASRIAVQYGLYEKHGFSSIDEYAYVNKKQFVDSEEVTLVTMIREAEKM